MEQVNYDNETSGPFFLCGLTLPCGHECKGVAGESSCLPCLNAECIEAAQAQVSDRSQESDDMNRSAPENNAIPLLSSAAESELCGICFTCELGEEACVRLGCGHVFHANCVKMLLDHKWTTLRISFGYLDCPACKQEISIIGYQVPLLTEMINQALCFKGDICQQATVKAMEEGYDRRGRVVTEGDIYFNDLIGFALHNCSFYMCFKCEKPYFGGMQDCGQAMQAENKMKKEDLMCEPCATEELGFG